ncbi:MAG TPA: mycofactocin precursor MftA [Acidimicrobiales bacterium]|nr:mycofactocin precursor MftA [Acidimicrobiales bacterium]
MVESAAHLADVEEAAEDQDLVEEELLVEDVSIDGMCGVY